MTDETTRLQARVKVLEDALQRLLAPFGDDACRLDHHGYCQEHFIEEDCCVAFARAALAASIPADPVINAGCCQAPSPPEHYDDYCIRQFAKLMSEKMAASRAKGRSGWHDPEKCSVEYLRSLLYEHLDKGDPVDVANFCMMLRHYNASTYREFCNCTPKPAPVTPASDAAKVAALVEVADELLEAYSAIFRLGNPWGDNLRAALAAMKEV